MQTIGKRRSELESECAKYLSDVETQEREIAKVNQRLAEITNARERQDHLEKMLERNTSAISADKKLADEEQELRGDIDKRQRLAAEFRRKAEALGPRIEQAKG